MLGLTFCPGKSGASLYGDGWARDLEVDVDAIAAWGASAVLTLVEDHELETLAVRGLGAAIEARGMLWLHAPIVDVSVPNARFETRWIVIGHLIRNELKKAKRVVVHCRGGLGRAGMIAARLLVECGDEADRAIDKVRKARPGAIETTEQEGYVRSVRPLAWDHERLDRVLGCLFGGAVGDGFGYVIEFDRLSKIRARYGDAGLTKPVLSKGKLIVSDDTQMTLFTAVALADTSLDDLGTIEALRSAYLDWHRTQSEIFSPAEVGLLRHQVLWALRAPGKTCLSALAAGGWGSLEHRINDSKGCGGVMRVAPIGLMVDWALDRVVDVAMRAAAITHGHPSGFWSAGALALMVRVMAEGRSFEDALKASSELLARDPEAAETLMALIKSFSTPREPGPWCEVERGNLGEGWVGEEALSIAVYSFLASEDFAEVMRVAANHNGDSDSTASIAGQLFGVRYGLSEIPWAWVRAVDGFDPLCEVTAGIMAPSASQH